MRTGLFSLAGLFARAFLADSVIENFNVCKPFMIITDKPDEIVEYIINTMKHSSTILDAEVAFSHNEKKVIINLCKRYKTAKLKRFVKGINSRAFVIVESSSEIIGKGFRSIYQKTERWLGFLLY